MKKWSLSEVLQSYVAPPAGLCDAHLLCSRLFLGFSNGGPYEEHELRHLYDTYGASPRSSLYARNPAEYRKRVVAQVLLLKPEDLRYTLQSPYLKSSSDLIMCIEPSPSRSYSKKVIVSPAILSWSGM